ncbi:hypothetical protein OUZ56_031889 [Daphnia magna]|uniref:Uncharacterized protein n=1 Tax=Daphnia magna TaxID=35525 RepID=A0ABQ9ZWK0_9CRUS|nr:hypothetical protein OUZ56_031889 [Daphnia magna]
MLPDTLGINRDSPEQRTKYVSWVLSAALHIFSPFDCSIKLVSEVTVAIRLLSPAAQVGSGTRERRAHFGFI